MRKAFVFEKKFLPCYFLYLFECYNMDETNTISDKKQLLRRGAAAPENAVKERMEEEKMTMQEAILARHSVRAYLTRPIEKEIVEVLHAEISACNAESGLHLQLVIGEPEAFGGFMAHYGKFSNVENYIALVGPKGKALDEKLGWYGERLVLLAQTLGLNTCWTVLTFSQSVVKKLCVSDKGEELHGVIALGYGLTEGEAHESRPMRECFRAEGALPEWFSRGVKSAMLAPTARNQQRFRFTLIGGNTVKAESTGGICSKIDLGIVKYHFALMAGEENFSWE